MSRPKLWTSLKYNRFTFTKGFLDVGRPPLRFYEHLFPYCIKVYTFPALCMRFSLPRLEYRGEFWLHHQDIPSLSRLWMFFFFTRCIYHPNLGTIILSSLIRPTISHSNKELLCLFSLSSSMIWTITAFILSRLWALDGCALLHLKAFSFLAQVSSRL